jgi:hypothetical protein
VELVLVRLYKVSELQARYNLTTYLQIAKLSKLFSTVVKSTRERLDLLVHDLVSANIASLRKSLSADIAAVGSLPSVSPLVSLGVGQQ